ncbi:polymorphic toxin type 50 domain-containing protein [uncultured Gimesia sp.]|uniref:polymorphic toxin type 50 domain-containing protein n=1 Tax=uncultured Gimesia sp. TaxID=1678688 RepID=UPI00261038B1|nr:polymorphic toxin type 50 domain-containing protein [uncultured Gimesia sp.]
MSVLDCGIPRRAQNAPKNGLSDPPPIHEGQQGKHIIGHNNYIPGRSILRVAAEGLRKYAATGKSLRSTPIPKPGSRELVDFGKIIGDHVDPAIGITTPTQWGIFIYSKTGIHIIPVRPQVPRP